MNDQRKREVRKGLLFVLPFSVVVFVIHVFALEWAMVFFPILALSYWIVSLIRKDRIFRDVALVMAIVSLLFLFAPIIPLKQMLK